MNLESSEGTDSSFVESITALASYFEIIILNIVVITFFEMSQFNYSMVFLVRYSQIFDCAR